MESDGKPPPDNDWRALASDSGLMFLPVLMLAVSAALWRRDAASLPWLGLTVVLAGLAWWLKRRTRAGYLLFFFLSAIAGVVTLVLAAFGIS